MRHRFLLVGILLLAAVLGACAAPADNGEVAELEQELANARSTAEAAAEAAADSGEGVSAEELAAAEEAIAALEEELAEAQSAAAGGEEPLPEPTALDGSVGPLPAPTASPAGTQAPIGAGGGDSAPPFIVTAPAPLPTPDNQFEDYGLNPFVDTSEDNLSTFGLDVDTASYSVARRYVTDGLLPPPDAVRVEEFVNYFDQGYQLPSGVAFALYADGAPSPFTADGTYLMRIGVQGYDVPQEQRKPVSLTFVIDISGSMDMENRLGLVKQSLQLLVERLRADDRVAIVVFGSEARVALYATNGSDKSTILDAIYGLRTEGATNAEAGLRLGYQLANQSYNGNAINRVILLSDGVANVGATGPDAILESIRGYADAGITLTTVGFGMGNFNDVLMEQLADNGDGNYAYVDTLNEAERLFVDNMTSTLQTIAIDAKIQVDFNPETVARYRLLGYENRDIADEDFRNDAVDAGELGAGHTVTAIYALQLWPGGTGRLATVQLRWQDPDSHQAIEISGVMNTWDLAGSFDQASTHYQLAVVVAQYAEVLRGSPWAEQTSLGMLSAYSDRLAARLDDPDVAEFAFLVNRAWDIQGG